MRRPLPPDTNIGGLEQKPVVRKTESTLPVSFEKATSLFVRKSTLTSLPRQLKTVVTLGFSALADSFLLEFLKNPSMNAGHTILHAPTTSLRLSITTS